MLKNGTKDGKEALEKKKRLKAEKKRKAYSRRYLRTLVSTLLILLAVIGVAYVAATRYLPIFHVYSTSMGFTVRQGDIVLGQTQNIYAAGDIAYFYEGSKLCIRRIIAGGGETVDMDENGNISIDGIPLDEPYVLEASAGDADMEFPVTVPSGGWFVLGDNRVGSVDSRHQVMGIVDQSRLEGKIVFRLLPLQTMGRIGG